MRLSIAIVSNRDHKPQFTESLLGLIQYTYQTGHTFGMEFLNTMIARQVSLLPWGRQLSIDTAIKENSATHLLFIDDDMLFPPDALQMMALRKVPFIGVNYARKNPVLEFVAYDLNGSMMDSRDKTGIEEVSKLGFGMFLMDLRVLSTVPTPYFEIIWAPDECEGGYMPEDFYFCRKLRANGLKIHIDHDVSHKMGHVGDYIFL